MSDPDWMQHAACRGLDPELFHPEVGELTAPAKAVCDACPVRVECLEHAIVHEERNGVWGGVGSAERRRMISRRERGRSRPIPHGTREGYRRCHVRPEGACKACAEAQSRYMEYAPARVRRRETA